MLNRSITNETFSAIRSFLRKAPFSYKSRSSVYLPMLKILEYSKIQENKNKKIKIKKKKKKKKLLL
jgi:hypothetical protein